MQATIEQVAVPSTASTIDYLLNKVEKADAALKNSIENKIVSIGEKVIPDLIRNLSSAKGTKRGVVAMSLIRNGQNAIAHLKNFAMNNQEHAWMANYIINEIEGTPLAVAR
ncbi:MAG: hypothetical protein PHE78_02590 [Candidatus Gastranaerophilales bacterium]|nr:hypothetical protein [Candidatus Gastranaerophilales bacterium]